MRTLIYDVDYFVRYISLPFHIGGASTMNIDGTYNIYLNSNHYAEQQWESFKHELVHCEAGHLDEYKDIPLEIKEWEANHLIPVIRCVS